jgi:hypothetical protein
MAPARTAAWRTRCIWWSNAPRTLRGFRRRGLSAYRRMHPPDRRSSSRHRLLLAESVARQKDSRDFVPSILRPLCGGARISRRAWRCANLRRWNPAHASLRCRPSLRERKRISLRPAGHSPIARRRGRLRCLSTYVDNAAKSFTLSVNKDLQCRYDLVDFDVARIRDWKKQRAGRQPLSALWPIDARSARLICSRPTMIA